MINHIAVHSRCSINGSYAFEHLPGFPPSTDYNFLENKNYGELKSQDLG